MIKQYCVLHVALTRDKNLGMCTCAFMWSCVVTARKSDNSSLVPISLCPYLIWVTVAIIDADMLCRDPADTDNALAVGQCSCIDDSMMYGVAADQQGERSAASGLWAPQHRWSSVLWSTLRRPGRRRRLPAGECMKSFVNDVLGDAVGIFYRIQWIYAELLNASLTSYIHQCVRSKIKHEYYSRFIFAVIH